MIGFGLIHGLLIWYGDILFTYGLIGLLLLLFVKSKNVTLFVWSLCLLIIPNLLFTGLLYAVSLFEDISNLANVAAIEVSYQNYGNGTWGGDILGQNITDWLYSNNVLNFIFVIFNILPMFLIGMIFARNKWLHQVQEHQRVLTKIWIITFILFIVFKVGPYLIGNPNWLSMLQDAVGGSASAIFYLLTITFLYPKLTGLFQLIGSVGKMALSNYILQSIVGVLIFYSIGFGYYGELSPFSTLLIGIVVFAVQVVLSYLWLQKFKRGPLEWFWRSLIYKKKLSNKKEQGGE
ncbi:membrane protein [Gracilibacillus boraciitolerans JCM 21714]|uniref:Membrane protein n=1 Tax=Gracilibacillus boraciitolerans JCM 21714 TaxID=1298598 RepID=W4VJN5_9BACI|nr:membrane protein [Gracilibacillus boraciitolerans JCM 21714]